MTEKHFFKYESYTRASEIVNSYMGLRKRNQFRVQMHIGSCRQFPLVAHRRPRTSETAAKFFQDETRL